VAAFLWIDLQFAPRRSPVPAVEIRPFRRADRDQVAALVNAHAAAVVPGVAASVNAVLSQFEREPGEPLVDPWVAERRALVGEQDGGVVAAALVVRYRDDADVGPGYRGTAEIRWLLFRPEAPAGNPFWHDGWEAARRLLSTCLEVAAAWGVSRVGADGALPVPGVYGVPDSWPHVERLYREAGFTAPAEAVEAVHLADLERLPVLAPAVGMQVRRNVGINGVRFTAVLHGADVGYIEVDVLDGAERHPRVGGIADVGNLEVVPAHRRCGVGTRLVAEAAAWLRLGHVDRLLAYTSPDETALVAFLRAQGFVELTRTRRGWERTIP
jgi:GNAT superfamily N-acetyltransferase